MSTLFISHSSRDNAVAKELKRRLEEKNHHSVFLDLDPEKGIVAGQSWERTLYRKLRACRGVIALCSDNYLPSHWCFAEIALARMEGKHVIALTVDPLSADAKLPAILTEKQFIDLRQDPEDGYRRLWQGLEELELLGVAGEWDPKESPYLGLRAYQEKHAAVFFGRGAETRTGLELLDRGAPGLIMVLGSSGSGKSSLVRAGMIPRLRRDPDRWLVVGPFRPRRDPVAELADSLATAYRQYASDQSRRARSRNRIREKLEAGLPRASGADAELATENAPGEAEPPSDADERLRHLLRQLEELRGSPPQGAGPPLLQFLDWSLDDLRRICGAEPPAPAAVATVPGSSPLVEIADHLRRASGRRDARVLLVIDQFEELLGYPESRDLANRFLELLRDSIEVEHSPLMALGTMRSDFLGLLQRNRALRDIDFESLSVGPMSVDAMRRVIEEPARLGAIELEEGLADRLLKDTETPDALPLLSFTLWRLWADSKGGKLSVGQYEELGGLHGAVAREAESVLASARHQGKENEVRAAFLEKARLTEDGSYARQPVSWDRAELQRVRSILQAFEKRRLLVTRQEEGESPTLEVAHEALFRSWAPLKGWLDNNRTELLLKQQLARDAQAWDQNNRTTDSLWRGGRLQQAAELLESEKPRASREVTTLEGAFVHAGLRRRKVQRWTGFGIAALVFLSLGAGLIFALQAKNEAQAQARIADSGRLASASLLSRTERPDLAALLAIEALHTADTFDARNALLLALQTPPRLETFLLHDRGVQAVAFGPDGMFASGDTDGVLRLWRLEESGVTLLGELLKGLDGDVSSVAFGPDGILAAGVRGAVRLWRLGESRVTPLGEPLMARQGGVESIAFGPDGTLASGGGSMSEGTLQIWQLGESGATPLGEPLKAHSGTVWSVAFGPDGTLATGGLDGAARLWRVGESGAAPIGEILRAHEGAVWDIAFDPNGTLASGGADGMVRLWRLGESGATPIGKPLKGHDGIVRSLAFGPDGTLASGGADGTVRLWRLWESGADLVGEPLGHGDDVRSVAFGSGGTLASAGEDGTVRLWRLGESATTPFGKTIKSHYDRYAVGSVAFGPNGTLAASEKGLGTVWLWRLGGSSTTPLGERLDRVSEVLSVAVGPDGTLAALGKGGTVRLWRLGESGSEPLGEPPIEHNGTLRAVAIGQDRTLAVGGEDGTVRLWRLRASGATSLGEPLKGHDGIVWSVAFGPDDIFASGGRDGTVRLWRFGESGATAIGAPLKGHDGIVWSVDFGPYAILASGGKDGTVRLWRLGESGATALGEPLKHHTGDVRSVAFGPDEILASGGKDGTVRLWQLGESGATPLGEPLKSHHGAVSSVAFSPDGTLAAGAVGTVQLWHLGIESWRRAACRLASRNFALSEWQRYMGQDEPYRCTCTTQAPSEGVSCP